MKREILIPYECAAIASQHGLGGLYDLAQHLHEEKGIKRGDAFITMIDAEYTTTATGFYFNPAAGEGGILMATVGASHQENGLEGVRFLFASSEVAAAQAALLSELRAMETDANALRDPAFTVV